MPSNTTVPGLQNQATRDQAEQAVFGHTIPDGLYGDLIGDIARNADVQVTYNDHVPSKNKISESRCGRAMRCICQRSA